MAAMDSKHLIPTHGANKIPPRATWWKYQDSLEWQIQQLGMEFLCLALRDFPFRSKLGLQNLFGRSWASLEAYTIWMEAWSWVAYVHRPNFIQRTYNIDARFASSMVDCLYAAKIGSPDDLHSMD